VKARGAQTFITNFLNNLCLNCGKQFIASVNEIFIFPIAFYFKNLKFRRYSNTSTAITTDLVRS